MDNYAGEHPTSFVATSKEIAISEIAKCKTQFEEIVVSELQSQDLEDGFVFVVYLGFDAERPFVQQVRVARS